MEKSKKSKQLKDEETPSVPSLESSDSEKFPTFLDETKIVTLIFQDKENFEFYHNNIDPKNFELKPCENITRLIFNFSDKYGHPPNAEELANELDEFIKENPREPSDTYWDFLGKIIEPTDIEYTKDKVREFAQDRAFKTALLEGIESKKPILEKTKETINKLEKIEKTGSPKFEETFLSDVEEKNVRWFWRNKIPLGTVSLIVGYPNTSKSYFAMMMAAAVTKGDTLPGEHFENVAQKGSVIILSAEDDPETTIKKRVRVHGGDCSKVLSLGISKENYYMFNLKTDLKYLDEKIKELRDVKLIIIDPVSAYLGADPKFDSYKETHVRSTLAPVAELARKHDLAIVGIMHLNKKEEALAITRVSGSMAFAAAPRAVWLIAKNRDDKTLFHFANLKFNLGEKPSGLSYRIKKDVITFEDRNEEDLDPEELLSKDRGGESPIGEAKEFLQEIFKNDKERDTAEIMDNAKTDGIAIKTLKRAKKDLKITSKEKRIDGKNKWMWVFPERLIGLVKKEENPEEGK